MAFDRSGGAVNGEVIIGILASLFGGAIVAVTTAVVTRGKISAETDMLRAQAERERAEATRILMGLGLGGRVRQSATNPQPVGWFLSGADPGGYEIGVDHEIRRSGTGSGYIKALGASQFGTLMQVCDVGPYRGKRVRMCGYVRTQGMSPHRAGAQLWFRADGPDDKTIAFDNMQDRPIRGNQDWTQHCLVLDIPSEAVDIAFGLLVNRFGTAWLDSVTFEEVDSQTALTGGSRLLGPAENLDFGTTE